MYVFCTVVEMTEQILKEVFSYLKRESLGNCNFVFVCLFSFPNTGNKYLALVVCPSNDV